MARFITDLKRTHSCGQLTKAEEGQEVILFGWVNNRRDHGGAVFIDLRDRAGVTQVVRGSDLLVSTPRQIIMFLMREELKMSYPAIGDVVGGRDHTTAMHAHEKIKGEIDKDKQLSQDLDGIRQRLFVNNV